MIKETEDAYTVAGSAGFTYTGYYDGSSLDYVGYAGIYSSSSMRNKNNSYYLLFDTSYVYPQDGGVKYKGFAVCCIAN